MLSRATTEIPDRPAALPADFPAPRTTESDPAQASAREQTQEQASVQAATDLAPIWLQRLSLLILVLFCVYLGVLVAVLPWWTRVWDHNQWIQARPTLAAILHNGAVRGLVSGLGLLDIWIGISEAVHYRDHRA